MGNGGGGGGAGECSTANPVDIPILLGFFSQNVLAFKNLVWLKF